MKRLRLAPENTKFGFMRFRRVSYPLSALLSIISVLMFLFVGMNFGIDFAGGTQVDMRAKSGDANVADIRSKGEGLGVGPVEVQRVGAETDVLLRLGVQPGGDAGQQTAIAKIKDAFGADYEFRSVDSVGPTVSAELVQRGTLGVVVAILAVLTYLWFRFEWQFAVGAIIGTMHDLLLTVGFFCVTQLEFNQTSIAAILTIVGYSLNETVVVLDRIREVMRKYKRLSTSEIIDMSINAVLPRTIMTATTVFLALLALFFLGGHVIRSFSAAMIWGIFVATYSSIFICSPMLIYMGVRADTFDKMREKEIAGADVQRCEGEGEGVSEAQPRPAFAPGSHSITAYGQGAFAFAGMSSRGLDPGDAERRAADRSDERRRSRPSRARAALGRMRRESRLDRVSYRRDRRAHGADSRKPCAPPSVRPACASRRWRPARRFGSTMSCSRKAAVSRRR